MISNPFFLISILINALIAFFTMAVVIESILILFKIKPGRVRSTLRFFPFLSLLLDLTLNHFSIGYWLNPLNCGSCVQKLLLTLFFPELKNYIYNNEISLQTYLGLEISHVIFSIVFILFWTITLYFTLRLFVEGFIFARALRSMMKLEDSCNHSIKNISLTNALQNSHVKVFSSEKVTIPVATYFKAIFIPHEIVEKFPQEEFEAIVAHEFEHIRGKDQMIRLFSQLIAKIFWWVPTRSWQKKLEFDQETACDRGILRYGFNEESLASALVKVSKSIQNKTCKSFCYLSNETHPSLRRVQIMLGIPIYSIHCKWADCLVITIGAFIALVCALWA
jgi:beta-lactamase regulating signal transducer with metallopeptidase domain